MEKLTELILSLPGLKYSGGISQADMVEAQQSIGMTFAEDYAHYLLNFGQMQASGIELTGISDKILTSVVNTTLEERKNNTIHDGLYVIEDLGIEGIIYAQDSQGIVYEVSPGAKPKKVAESLFQYIQSSQKQNYMSELSSNNLEKTDGVKSELGKVANDASKLSEQELNAPIEEDLPNLEIPEIASSDCSSECKYVSGDSSKRMKFGYSG